MLFDSWIHVFHAIYSDVGCCLHVFYVFYMFFSSCLHAFNVIYSHSGGCLQALCVIYSGFGIPPSHILYFVCILHAFWLLYPPPPPKRFCIVIYMCFLRVGKGGWGLTQNLQNTYKDLGGGGGGGAESMYFTCKSFRNHKNCEWNTLKKETYL